MCHSLTLFTIIIPKGNKLETMRTQKLQQPNIIQMRTEKKTHLGLRAMNILTKGRWKSGNRWG